MDGLPNSVEDRESQVLEMVKRAQRSTEVAEAIAARARSSSFSGQLPSQDRIPQAAHPSVSVKIALAHPLTSIPVYATSLSSGFDLMARLDSRGAEMVIMPGDTALIDTGLKMEIPPGYELQIRSRSGLALKNGIVVLNSPGTVDADYKGLIKVILKNTSQNCFCVAHGMKIAQGVICPVVRAQFVTVDADKLEKTDRGEGGFGSTGL